ncbi:MAG: hypothetical protein PWQ29_632 [Verrucomicrobiota bacterium]|jgi:pimeloyl-ACP methyl ester carboxylesterase|nr:hypothetical protein [Verrucomicrobiota bacterium]
MNKTILFLCAGLLLGLVSVQADETATGSLTYDARLTGYAYPFRVEFYSVSSQGKSLEMAYMYLEGDKNKPVVTLLHGKNFNGAYWAQTARWLQDQGYSILIPDQIGFGKSSKPVDYQFSFAALATNTRKLMDELNIRKSIVVGHSMGGMLASRFALLYPDRTQKLILVNPIGLENYLQYVQYKDVDFFYRNELGQTAETIRRYQQKNYYDGTWSKTYAAWTYPLIGWAQGPDKDQLAKVSARTYDMIFTQPTVTEFPNIQVPTALILGTRDRTGPGRGWKRDGVDYELGRYDRLGRQVIKLIPQATLYELPGLGHLPQIEDFDRFKEVFAKALVLNSEQK